MIYQWFVDQLSESNLRANLIVSLNLIGALGLGFVVGYERSYHGRAAGMRTYGLMCMASAALTMVSGHPEFWYMSQKLVTTAAPDPTRVIQGIVTGVGFLCA
ncbi:MAG: MgtC/SapB family protein, partial [Burkholderiaceae bacterium]|nr:MgtC/SapB family protein [Burkholderiaceae bacterium]